MTTDRAGLYVHIPFCLKKCDYCDFCSYVGVSPDVRRRYIDALIREIHSYKREPLTVLDTVFFGGGTPTLLTPDELSRICAAIRESFDTTSVSEFTVEANPKTLDKEKCLALCAQGVNRISIGVQSVHGNELRALGRVHSYGDFLESFRLAKEYFDNISVDVMYGIPEQTPESFKETLEALCALDIKHISVYGLMLEEGTPLYTSHVSLNMPSEDEECDMYYLAADFLKKAGFTHYEISNYAKDGWQSRHNLGYWRMQDYIGVGLTAASCFDSKRYVNTADFEEYFKADFTNYNRSTDECDGQYEYAMLALRLKDGISLSDYRERFGTDFTLGKEEKIREYSDKGLLNTESGRLHLTEKGFYVSNYILSELL